MVKSPGNMKNAAAVMTVVICMVSNTNAIFYPMSRAGSCNLKWSCCSVTLSHIVTVAQTAKASACSASLKSTQATSRDALLTHREISEPIPKRLTECIHRSNCRHWKTKLMQLKATDFIYESKMKDVPADKGDSLNILIIILPSGLSLQISVCSSLAHAVLKSEKMYCTSTSTLRNVRLCHVKRRLSSLHVTYFITHWQYTDRGLHHQEQAQWPSASSLRKLHMHSCQESHQNHDQDCQPRISDM